MSSRTYDVLNIHYTIARVELFFTNSIENLINNKAIFEMSFDYKGWNYSVIPVNNDVVPPLPILDAMLFL